VNRGFDWGMLLFGAIVLFFFLGLFFVSRNEESEGRRKMIETCIQRTGKVAECGKAFGEGGK
jgi:hypothetical protein